MELEYVSSGNSALKILTNENLATTAGPVKDMIRGLNNAHGKFSMLFNAFTETNLGKSMRENFTDDLHSIHADSGGLQMITLGKSITEAQKREIYKIQGMYSDVAMCFDEIPVSVVGKGSVTGISARVFDRNLVKDLATETGKNIRAQIETFEEMGSNAHPMMILQGNCIESFQEWINWCCDAVGDKLDKVGGISVAGSSLGNGHLEDICRAATILCKYPTELNTKKIHLLGVGAPNKFLPYVALYDAYKDTHISYDSTSHTKSIFSGIFMYGSKTYKVRSMPLDVVDMVLSEIEHLTSVRMTFEQFTDVYNGSLMYKEKTGKLGAHCDDFTINLIAIFFLMVYKCQEEIRQFVTSRDIVSRAPKGSIGVYQTLSQVKTYDDYIAWERDYARYLRSNRIVAAGGDTTDIGILFED